MADWRERSTVNGDVVFFSYVSEGMEKNHDEVFIWDIDKTYLDTKIDSLSGLFNAAIEKALAKKNVPGTSILLRNLAEFRKKSKGAMYFPIYFISASPPQMEDRITDKFNYDGIRPFGCFYKDNLINIRPGRFGRLTKQIGYKLQALMELRLRLSENVKQICWGDDSESDAIIYNLYSDLCARKISSFDARGLLGKLKVSVEQTETILDLLARVPENDPIEKIYINLATDTDPEYYLKFGRRTVATANTFQVSIDLYQDRRIDLDSLESVFLDMVSNYNYTMDQLIKTIDQSVVRGLLGTVAYTEIKERWVQKGYLYESFEPSLPPKEPLPDTLGASVQLKGHSEPWIAEAIDYLTDYT